MNLGASLTPKLHYVYIKDENLTIYIYILAFFKLKQTIFQIQ